MLRTATLTALCALAAFALCSSPAWAGEVHIFDSSFGEEAGPGQLHEPDGVALNEETGNVYVADRGDGRIEEFNATGTVLGEFSGASAPTGALEKPSQIAIDNSGNPLDPSENDVYVTGEVAIAGEAVHVIYKFSATGAYLGQIKAGNAGAPFSELLGVAVDQGGKLWVFQENKEIDNYSNALENEFGVACEDPRGPGVGLAVDTEENLYVNTGNATFAKLSGVCAETIEEVGSEASSAAAVDVQSNDIYVDNLTSVGLFDSSAKPLERFGEEHLGEGAGVAVNSASANKLVYLADRKPGAVKRFRQVLRPTVITEAPTEAGPTKATLNGSVNPEGLPVSSCLFEYGTSTAYESTVPCEADPGAGKAPVAVAAKLTGLSSDTTYHYRILAGNENGPSLGADESFTTPGPGLHGSGVIDVSSDAATFQATIDPHGAPTSFYFQYGTSSALGQSAPAAPGLSLGAGEGDVEVTPQHVQGLSPGTLYHYRVVAVSGKEEFPGPEQTFSTQGAGGQLTLPDGRSWEMVSPPDKRGAVIQLGGVVEAAAGGGALSYVANAPTEAAPPGFPGAVSILSTRGPAGWSTRDLASSHQRVTGKLKTPPEYRLFAEDLSAALVQPYGLFEAGLSEEASEQTPYLDTLGACASGCYRPLVSGKAGHGNVPAGTRFGEEQRCEEGKGVGHLAQTICGPLLLGATSDLSHVVLVAEAPLAAGAGREELYEWAGGKLQLISVLPENEAGEELPAPAGSARLGAGFRGNELPLEHETSAKRAISADGARIFWETRVGEEPTLYVRDSEREQSLQLDTAEAACLKAGECESGGGRFQIADAKGESVLFTDGQRLTSDAGKAGFSDLYECRITIGSTGKLGCELTDLTPEHAGESARVQGSVLGAGEDGEATYFVAEGVLSGAANKRGAHAIAGQANLYAREGGVTSFIATLAAGDNSDWALGAENQPARVSPNGRWLTFMSEDPLTGYDNRDAVSGRPDAEVYLFDASTGRLSCASCEPSGARPRGVEYKQIRTSSSEQLVSGQDQWKETGWVAALTPESPSFDFFKSAHQPRYLTDSGRLFFNALDALVPQDVNGNWDAYEREPAGVGSCAPGAPGFESNGESCLGLISSGASAQESTFLDASDSGGDAFFLTSARLTPQDFDGARDIYDAHECTSASPCLPQEAVAPPPCSTEASCKPAPSPQPQIFGAPASATFSGPGNPPSPPAPKAKPPTRAELLAKALSSCHKRYPRSKARRGSCERAARRKYSKGASTKKVPSGKKAPAKKGAAKRSTKGAHR